MDEKSRAIPSRGATAPASWSPRIRRYAVILLLAFVCNAGIAIPHHSQSIAASSDFRDQTDRLEVQMWELINRDRAAASSLGETKGRAHPLQWDDRLAAVARAHSEEMARNGFFSHEGLDGSLPASRVSAAGTQWLSTGENIAKASDVVQAETLFMDEPKFEHNHRGNILNPNYTRVGVGIARGPDGELYITQEFVQVR